MILLIVLTGLILLITLAVTYLFFKRWIGFCRVALKEVAEVLMAEPTLDIWNVSASVQGRMDGRPLTVSFTNQTRSSPPNFTVTIPVDTPVAMTLRRPNFLDRWCARVGLVSPIFTGDPRFDSGIYVDTGDRKSVRMWFSDPRFRESLLGLFHGDVMRIACGKGTLSIVRKLPPREMVASSLVFESLPSLYGLVECLNPATHSAAQGHKSTRQIMTQLGLAPGLLLMIGTALIIVGMELYEPLFPVFLDVLSWSIPWSLSAGAVYGISALRFVRFRTDRHRLILMILALTLPGCCLGTMGWRYFGNGWLDQGRPGEYEGAVWETLNKGRGGRKIVFMVNGKPSAEFRRPKGTYARGLPVQLTVYPGYFGIPWIHGWQVDPGNRWRKNE